MSSYVNYLLRKQLAQSQAKSSSSSAKAGGGYNTLTRMVIAANTSTSKASSATASSQTASGGTNYADYMLRKQLALSQAKSPIGGIKGNGYSTLARMVASANTRNSSTSGTIATDLPASSGQSDAFMEQAGEAVANGVASDPSAHDVSLTYDGKGSNGTSDSITVGSVDGTSSKSGRKKGGLFKHDSDTGNAGLRTMLFGGLLIAGAVVAIVATGGLAVPVFASAAVATGLSLGTAVVGFGAAFGLASGAVLATKGAFEVGEGITGKNALRDKVFKGNEQNYQRLENEAVKWGKFGYTTMTAGMMVAGTALKLGAEAVTHKSILKRAGEYASTQWEKAKQAAKDTVQTFKRGFNYVKSRFKYNTSGSKRESLLNATKNKKLNKL